MDKVQKELYGTFPRAVGNPNQWIVHSEGEFDVFLENNNGKWNCYSSIARFPAPGGIVGDKVSYDFDSPGKDDVFYDVEGDHIKVEMMREDPDIAEEVLGQVARDAGHLAKESMKNGIPTIGVFTGLGIHVHQLFQPTPNPADAITSTAIKCIEELNLETADKIPVGDVQRILRVPNCQRVHVEGVFDETKSIPCPLYTIPLTAKELEEFGPQELLEESKEPRQIDLDYLPERPEMRVFDDYLDEQFQAMANSALEITMEDYQDEDFARFVKRILKMPCMYERVIQPNPRHDVRRNLAVLLFNMGYSVDRAVSLIRRLNWRDFNQKTTRAHLQHIWDKGYADMSCRTMIERGLCTRMDDPESCPTYGWKGGQAEWKKR
jgi:hypothetical protein